MINRLFYRWLLIFPLLLTLQWAQAVPSSGQEGPIRLVADLVQEPKEVRARYFGFGVGAAESQVFFVASDSITGVRLWRSDGTEDGAVSLMEICPRFCEFGSYELLPAMTDQIILIKQDQIWVSDGRPEGTQLVTRLPFSIGSDIGVEGIGFESAGSRWILRFYGINFAEPPADSLWSTDGTAEGTYPLPLPEGARPYGLTETTDQAFFRTSGGSGELLWRTDGTADGTRMVRSCEGACGEVASIGLDHRIVSVLETGEEVEIWVSDGTEEGTRQIQAFAADNPLAQLRIFDQKVYGIVEAAGQHVMWASDGTEDGTGLAPELLPSASIDFFRGLYSTDSALYVVFDAVDEGTSESPSELWVLLGPVGRQKLAEHDIIFVQSTGTEALFFSRYTSEPFPGESTYWTTRGTPETTESAGLQAQRVYSFGDQLMLAQIVANPEQDALWFQPADLSAAPRPVFLSFSDGGSNPEAPIPWGERLAVATHPSDSLYTSADANLWLLGEDPPQLLSSGDVGRIQSTDDFLFQVAPDAEGLKVFEGGDLSSTSIHLGVVPFLMDRVENQHFLFAEEDQQLWVTQGNQESTELLESIHPGWQPATGPLPVSPGRGITPLALSSLPDRVLASAFQDAEGPGELWSSDGTSAGTRQIEVFPVSGDEFELPSNMIRVGSEMFFFAPDAAGHRQVWVTDGEPFSAVPLTAFSVDYARSMSAWGSGVVFHTLGTNGNIWRLVDSQAEPELLAQLGNVIGEMLVSSDKIFVAASDAEAGQELWVIDGSEQRVIDIFPGNGSSRVRSTTPIPGGIFFSADDGSGKGSEPWISAGTEETTRRLADLYPGHESSDPQNPTVVGNSLYFSARAPDVGRELFALDLEGLDFSCPADRLCLQNGRFEVQLRWSTDDRSGIAQRVASTDDSGLYSFFDPDNWEAMVKVLDGCAVNGHFWVFGATATDVGYTLIVEDTFTGAVRTYTNSLGSSASAITDTEAFGGC